MAAHEFLLRSKQTKSRQSLEEPYQQFHSKTSQKFRRPDRKLEGQEDTDSTGPDSSAEGRVPQVSKARILLESVKASSKYSRSSELTISWSDR